MWVGSHRHAPGGFTPGKEFRHALYKSWLGWALGPVWTVTENTSHTRVRALNRVSGSWLCSLVFVGVYQNETPRAGKLT